MPHAPTVLAALEHALRREPSRPLLTYYDGSSGERVELSVVTFTNWVHKIANLFGDELMLDHDDVVQVRLPTHWQSAVCIVGAWAAGLPVRLDTAGPRAGASIVGPDAVADPATVTGGGSVVACSLRPMAAPFDQPLPDGWLDFAREVPPQPDALVVAPDAGPETVAVVDETGSLTHAELAVAAEEAAIEPGLLTGGRLLTDANPASRRDLLVALAAPVLLDASVVLVARCDDEQRATVADQERVNARWWVADR
jgi:uncharacterized protein (TIGR03089 family)